MRGLAESAFYSFFCLDWQAVAGSCFQTSFSLLWNTRILARTAAGSGRAMRRGDETIIRFALRVLLFSYISLDKQKFDAYGSDL